MKQIKRAKTYNYSILRPGGNDTALVEGIVSESGLRKQINDEIMRKNPYVEQVGFIDNKDGKYQLQMAGGEFCGNATRSAAYLFLGGKSGNIRIEVSGIKKKLKAGVDGLGSAWAQMPVYSSPNKIERRDNELIVEMEGITHVIVKEDRKFENKRLAQERAKKILKELDLLSSVKASGVIFVNRFKQDTEIEPVVWVRDIETFFYETACASGTAAVGLTKALSKKKSLENLKVLQPSGISINVSVQYNNNKFNFCKISGPIQVLKQNVQLSLNN